jgi:creatinine amidohydrolase
MRFWKDLTTEEFSGVDPDRWVAVLPVAAIEQHGPHLPVSVDTDLAEGVIEHCMRIAPAELPAICLPTLCVGKSNEHSCYAGTLSLSVGTLLALWTDVAESVYRSGFRKIVFVNTHGGQPQVVEIVCRDLRVRLGMLAVAATYGALGIPDGLFSPEELKHGIHGGELETSMMLYLRPEAVRMAKAKNFVPHSIALEREFEILCFEGSGAGFGWMSQDNCTEGTAGDASKADVSRGRLCIEHAATRLLKLLEETSRFPLSRLQGQQAPLPHRT